LLPRYLNTLPAGPAFYAHVFHPEFNLDVDECVQVVERFERHVRVVDGRVGVLRGVMAGFRETRNGEWCEFGVRGY
jgi:sorting nexin-9/18/33